MAEQFLGRLLYVFMVLGCSNLCRFLRPKYHLLRYAVAQRFSYLIPDYATKNGGHLLEAIHIHVSSGAGGISFASYSDTFFREV